MDKSESKEILKAISDLSKKVDVLQKDITEVKDNVMLENL